MGFDPVKINPSVTGYIWFEDLEIEDSYTGSPNPWKDYGLDGGTHFQENIAHFQGEVEARFKTGMHRRKQIWIQKQV